MFHPQSNDKYDKISRTSSSISINLICYADNTLMLTDEMYVDKDPMPRQCRLAFLIINIHQLELKITA